MSESQRPRLAAALKWGIALAAAAGIAPFIFMTVQGLVGLAIAAVVGLVIVNAAPVVSMYLSNMRLTGIKWAARTNPVETLQNQLVEKREQLVSFRDSIASFSAAVKGFEGKVSTFKSQQPEQAERFEAQLLGMKQLLSLRRARYKEADVELDKFEIMIQRASALWDMSLEAARMNKLAGQQDAGAFERIKTDVAFDSIESSLNRAFAELETSLLDEAPAITHQPVDTIDVTAVDVRERLRV